MVDLLFGWVKRQRFQLVEAERDQLRETVMSLQNENLRLQDRITAAQQDRERLWEVFDESLKGERAAYQLHINMSMQRLGGGVPYPDAPHLPEHAVPQPSSDPAGRRGRILMSEAVRGQVDRVLSQRFAGKTE